MRDHISLALLFIPHLLLLLLECRSTMDLGLPLGSTKRCLKVHIESCSVRVAISHLVLHRLLKAHAPVVIEALKQPITSHGQASSHEPSHSATGDGGEVDPFRQSFNSIDLRIKNEVSAWLCNDGSHSFGAPDVLQVCPLSERLPRQTLVSISGCCQLGLQAGLWLYTYDMYERFSQCDCSCRGL